MIGVIGLGYVGLTTCLGLCSKGQLVIGCDNNAQKISQLKNGISTIHELDLDVYLSSALEKHQIIFTTQVTDVITYADLIYITVGTPATPSGNVDLQFISQVINDLGKHLINNKIIVIKSTVPVGTCVAARETINCELRKRHLNIDFEILSNPEFLREGTALHDFLFPYRIVLGVDSERAKERMQEFYIEIYGKEIMQRIIYTDSKTAELAKYSCNSFLAVKISFINEIANFCDSVSANVMDISTIMGLDPRIGSAHLNPGPGFGGSCFPKDLAALIRMGTQHGLGLSICESAYNVNKHQWEVVIQKVEKMIEILRLSQPTITVLGLTFKANTDDVRESPSLKVLDHLLKCGYSIKAYDPYGIPNFSTYINHRTVYLCESMEDAMHNADIAIIMTEWSEFENISADLIRAHMRTPALIDTRNICRKKLLEENGVYYCGIGQGG